MKLSLGSKFILLIGAALTAMPAMASSVTCTSDNNSSSSVVQAFMKPLNQPLTEGGWKTNDGLMISFVTVGNKFFLQVNSIPEKIMSQATVTQQMQMKMLLRGLKIPIKLCSGQDGLSVVPGMPDKAPPLKVKPTDGGLHIEGPAFGQNVNEDFKWTPAVSSQTSAVN
jgi:hypothetical protein